MAGFQPSYKNATHIGCGPTLGTSLESTASLKTLPPNTVTFCHKILPCDFYTRTLHLNLLMSLEETQSIPKQTHLKLTDSVKTGVGVLKASSLYSNHK